MSGSARGWISRRCLCDKTQLLGNVMDALWGADCDQHIKVIRNSSFNALARIGFMLHEWQRKLEIEDRVSIVAEVDYRERTRLWLRADREGGLWSLKLEGDAQQLEGDQLVSSSNRRIKLHFAYNAFKPDQVELERQALERQHDELALAFANRNYGYSTERLIGLSHWMNEEFGVVSVNDVHYTKGDRFPSTGKSALSLEKLNRQIARLFNADIVTIFHYQYPDQKDPDQKNLDEKEPHEKKRLISQGPYFHERYPDEKIESWRDAEHETMRNATRQQKKESISYRAIMEKKARFCRAFDKDPNRCDPESESLLNPSDDFPRKCAMALPLNMFGRLWGVLEIDGARPHQFRFDQFVQAQQVADVVGPRLYQIFVLDELARLSFDVLDDTKGQQEKYIKICEGVARLLFADGSYLYVQNPQKQGAYNLVAGTGKCWEETESQNKTAASSPRRLKGTVVQALDDLPPIEGKDKRPFFTYDLEHTNKKWFTDPAKPQRKGIEAGNYQWRVIIPVSLEWDRPIICRLSLFYKDKDYPEEFRNNNRIISSEAYDIRKPLHDGWQSTVEFIARYVATLANATRATAPWKSDSLLDLMEELHQGLTELGELQEKTGDMTTRLNILKRELDTLL